MQLKRSISPYTHMYIHTHIHTESLVPMATNHLKFPPTSGTKVKSLKWTPSPTWALGSPADKEVERKTNYINTGSKTEERTLIRRGQVWILICEFLVKVVSTLH